MHRALVPILLMLAGAAQADVIVEVEGVSNEQRDNVLAFLGIQQYRTRQDLGEAMVRRLHDRAPEEIRRALIPFGFYRARIDAELQQTETGWRARYVINRGPPVRIHSVDIGVAGIDEAQRAFRDIIAASPVTEGAILRHADYENLKTTLMNRATQRGYLDAEFHVQRLAVNTDSLAAAIDLELVPGPRYYFGELRIEQDILDDDFVRRYATFSPGEPLDFDQLLDLQYALTDSEYFKAVQVEALRDAAGEDRRVPVVVRGEANERSRYTAGIGYGTDTGPRISLGFQRRYVNRRGHRLSVQTQFSEVEDTYFVRYTIPLAEPASESFQLFGGTTRQERADAESDRLMLGASRVRTLGDWEQTLYLRAEREDSILPGETFRTESFIPGASWMKISADDHFYTRDGYKLYADLHGSAPALGSRTEYAQLHIVTKRILPLGDRWRVLLRAEAATTMLGDTSRLPVSQRFFAGGDQSVRGYDYNRLAPTDADGNVIGGQYLATGSAEIEYRFADSWAVAAFVDTGNAMDDLDARLQRAHGVGLRWLSPVGAVRLDLARPANADTMPSNGFEIHISVGPDL